MTKNERLLRAAALILIVRDEFEDLDVHEKWCKEATKYIDLLTGKDEIVNEQYNNYFSRVDQKIRKVIEPSEVANELFVILRKDLNTTKITHSIIHATNKVELSDYDVQKVKLLDSITSRLD